MGDWFRNEAWDDEIAGVFDARLARARDKGQYLNIQAYTLLATRPDVAADLCRRAIALDDPHSAVQGGMYLGTALALQGDVDGAIDALERLIQTQQCHPRTGSAAYVDQALLVAIASRRDLYAQALTRLAREESMPIGELDLSALIALALIHHDLGGGGSAFAQEALVLLDGFDEAEAALPTFLDLASIRERLHDVVDQKSAK